MRSWFREVWNERKLQTIHDLMADHAVAKGQSVGLADIHGPAEFVAFAENIHATFSDMKMTIEDAFGTGDKVAVRWSATVTHSGDGLGVPATGNVVHFTGITMVRIEHGKIVEGWDSWDQLGVLSQIGAYTPPDAVAVAKS